MTEAQFKAQMSVMMTFYPSQKLSQEALRAYWMKFHDAKFDVFKRACEKAVDESEFVPTVALINRLMGGEYSFENVYHDLKRIIVIPEGGSFRGGDLHPTTQAVLKSLGGKSAMGMMTNDELKNKAKREYRFAFAGIEDDRKRIKRYRDATKSFRIKEICLDNQPEKH